MKRRAALQILAAAAAACNRSGRKKIGVIPKGTTHLFWQSVHAGAVKASREENMDLLWNGPPGETDFNGQIRIIESMINRRVDAIALAPIDRKAMVNAVERAAREGVPVVIFDSALDTDKYLTEIATDNYRAGELAAERMAKILDGKGEVAILAVMPGSAATMDRESGFENWLQKNAPAMRVVDKQFGMADVALSLTKSENMLTAHPALAGIFSSNESGTIAASQALKSRQGGVKLVGFDASPALVENIRSGLLDSIIIQDPFRMGYESVKAASRKLAGETVPRKTPLMPRLVTIENLNDPEVQAQMLPDLKRYLD